MKVSKYNICKMVHLINARKLILFVHIMCAHVVYQYQMLSAKTHCLIPWTIIMGTLQFNADKLKILD